MALLYGADADQQKSPRSIVVIDARQVRFLTADA
jgi:hypothetical protein